MKWICLIGCFVSMLGAVESLGIIHTSFEMNNLIGVILLPIGGLLLCASICIGMKNLENFLILNKEK